MEYSYKFRIYPNREQEAQILRTFGCCRFLFNHYLAKRRETYEQSGQTLNYYDCAADLTLLKKELNWLREVDSTALQSALRFGFRLSKLFSQGKTGRKARISPLQK